MKLYTLYDSIASGGMGTVYYGRANGSGGLSRVVAIKRMHGDLARDPVCLEMFRDELRLATRVRHPNVVATLDVAEQEGDLLMVMEFVQGESVQELISRCQKRSEKIPPAIAVAIACGILQGLEAVHEAKGENGEPLGIVHRDVSPENVLVGRDGIPRLLDFGIARGAGRKHVTRVGELKGKPSYLAPEQILDGGPGVDRRADIYGVSIVLWEALTGQRLFEGDSPTVALSKVLSEPVPRPSSIVAALPQALDEIVLRGLSRNPADRYATALEMARALRSACGTLLPFEVAEWLEQVAPDSLSRQAARVAELERSPLPSSLDARPAPALAVDDEAPESTRTSMTLTPRTLARPKLPLATTPSLRALQSLADEKLAPLKRKLGTLRERPRASQLGRASARWVAPYVRRYGLTALVAIFGFSVGISLVRSAVSMAAPSAPAVALAAAPALPSAAVAPLPSAPLVAPAAPPAVTRTTPASSAKAETSNKKRKPSRSFAAPAVKRLVKVDDGF